MAVKASDIPDMSTLQAIGSRRSFRYYDPTKTVEELRKPKLDAWNRNKENSRAWLALNMMTEARAGFTAFNEGPKDDREADFIKLRLAIAAGESWVGDLHDRIQPKKK